MDQLEQQLHDYIRRYHRADDRQRPSVRKNVNPKVWGPPGWAFIDKIVEGYPDKPGRRDRIHMLEFLTSLGHVLPCADCRANHIAFSKRHPPKNYVNSKENVRKWIRLYKRMKK